MLQTLAQLELILTFWNGLLFKYWHLIGRFCYLRHIAKSNEITIINTCGTILIFEYLGSAIYERKALPGQRCICTENI